jgi:hypothetical protein
LCVVPARDATPEEQEMEAEVEGLRKQLEELQTATPDETDTIGDLKKELDEKERALYTLQVRQRLALGLGGQGMSVWVHVGGGCRVWVIEGTQEGAGHDGAPSRRCRCGKGWSLLAWVERGQCRGAGSG